MNNPIDRRRARRDQLMRRGEGVARNERLATGRTTVSMAFEAFCRDHDLNALGIDPDVIFGDVRDRTPGRDA